MLERLCSSVIQSIIIAIIGVAIIIIIAITTFIFAFVTVHCSREL